MDRRKIIGAAVFSAAIAGGGVAGVILGSPASGSAATTNNAPTTTTPGHKGPFGMGRRGGPRFGMGHGFGFAGGASADAVAKALGISTDTLRTDLQSGKSIADIAKAQGVSTQTVITTLVAQAKSAIDAQVKAGHLTSDQATKIESHLTQTITDAVNGKFQRPDAPKGANGPNRGFGFRGGFGLDAAAKSIGVSTDTLLNDIKGGKTIAQVATSKGVATKTVIAAMVAAAKSQFDAQVKAGHLTADQASKIEANLTQMITNQVNGTFPKPNFGGKGPGGQGWRGGPGAGMGGFGKGFGGPPPGENGGGSSNTGSPATTSAAPTV